MERQFIRSQGPSPPVKLYQHRVDGTDGSGASSYGEVRSDITMSYKPIAPAPSGSNHTPPVRLNSLFPLPRLQCAFPLTPLLQFQTGVQ
nr:uncharacterized protein LOC115137291 isoform X3 [Oncorhynchus nerka]